MSSLVFRRRAKVKRTVMFVRRMWTASDGVHRVSEFKRCDGTKVFYAERKEVTALGECWEMISRHRKRQAAINACCKEVR